MNYRIEFTNKKQLLEFNDFISKTESSKYKDKLLKKVKNLLQKKSIKTSSKKGKGRDLQQWTCQKIADMFDIIYDQSDDQCLIHSREMGQSGTDIILRGEVYSKFKFDIECKNTENLTLYKSIEQAKNNTEANRNWLLVHKKNYSDPIVIMDWEAFEKLFKKTLY